MKKFLCFLMGVIIILSFSACGGSPAPETERAAELRGQYTFYDNSVKEICKGMGVTSEQADDIFITLVSSCGLDGYIKDIYKKNGQDNTYSYYWDGSAKTYDVVLDNGAISKVIYLSNIIYPLELSADYLNEQEVENVVTLIEGLNADSPRSDYEAAQLAYDSLTNNLQKQIPENLVDILSGYNLSTMTIETAVEDAIQKAGATKVNVMVGNGVVSIYLKGTENLTTAAVRRGMFYEARDILKALQERGEITKVALFWTYPLVDKLGNEKEESVMKIQLEKETLQSINFEKFDFNNFPDIADDYFEHAALSD